MKLPVVYQVSVELKSYFIVPSTSGDGDTTAKNNTSV